MLSLFKEKNLQILSLSLIIISFFLPWYRTYNEINSLYLESESYFSIISRTNRLPLIYDFGYGIWGSITVNLHSIVAVCSILLPILSGITIYRIIKNKRYLFYKKTVFYLTIVTILNYINYFLFYNIRGMETSLKIGVLIALISLIGLTKDTFFEGKLKSLISRLIPTLISKVKLVNQKWTQKNSMDIPNHDNDLTTNSTIENVNYCSTCGHKVEKQHARFCINCGENFFDSESSNNNKQNLPINNTIIKRYLNLLNNIGKRGNLEVNLKIDKRKLVKIVLAALVIILAFSLLNGTSGGKGAAKKEVQKLITYKLERQYSKKMVRSISFSDMEVDKVGDYVYKVSGEVDYKIKWENTKELSEEGLIFWYYMEYWDGEWSISRPERSGDGGGFIFFNK